MHRSANYLPPPGGSAWTGGSELPLLYLAWGERRYGRTPLRAERRCDWLYVSPRSGSPTVILNGKRRKLPAGHCLILSPDCVSGYEDAIGGRCFIQTWVWSAAPHFPILHPTEAGGFRHLPLSPVQARELAAIHSACREEVQRPDAFTSEALAGLRLRLDLCLARGPSGRFDVSPPRQRLALARRWLREHLADHAPSVGLCNYLQVSPATLRRLFVNEIGHGPREEALRLRLSEARRLIEDEGWSVKAAAYHLGYKHPNDLSRAMR